MGIINRIIKSPAKDADTNGKRKTKEVDPKRYRIRYPANRGYRYDTGIEFKSKMEANIFRFLKTRKFESVEYEPELWYFKPNKFGIKAYVPDFKVTFGKRVWYFEVKGFFEKQDFQKAWLVSKNYPWIKLFYIGPDKYNLIRKSYSKHIKNWE